MKPTRSLPSHLPFACCNARHCLYRLCSYFHPTHNYMHECVCVLWLLFIYYKIYYLPVHLCACLLWLCVRAYFLLLSRALVFVWHCVVLLKLLVNSGWHCCGCRWIRAWLLCCCCRCYCRCCYCCCCCYSVLLVVRLWKLNWPLNQRA